MIRVYDAAGNLIETHEHAGDFKVCEARETKSRHARSRKVVNFSCARATKRFPSPRCCVCD
jgi:hypothetical protein